MYLDKVFIKDPHVCIVLKKELVCVFPFLGKKSLEIKKNDCKMLLKELYHIASKSFSNFHLKLSTIFILKMCFLKNSTLASFMVLSVITATLFITAK